MIRPLLIPRLNRFWHALTHFGHQNITTNRSGTVILACSCGRVFWSLSPEDEAFEIEFFRELGWLRDEETRSTDG